MAVAIHVSGPALIYVGFPDGGTGGGGGGLQQLGITEDGADVEINGDVGDVKTDAAGPTKPADLQEFGEDANIRLALSAYDLDVLKNIRWRGNAAGEGKQSSRGRLIGANGDYFKLVIASETDEPWRFFTCILRGPQGIRLGTKYTVQRLNIYAWALVGAGNTAKDVPLYDHVNG